ncbi:MAG: hypothetical protein FJ316_04600 [SAR202 cluster bacterium]|nr:hypothetical protein [SAR202 cluster bacterium]
MSLTTIRAHFDGQQVQLDEPCQLAPGTPLLVVILAQQPELEEREDWTRLSLPGLSRAYGDQEPEYSLDAIKEHNPEYQG